MNVILHTPNNEYWIQAEQNLRETLPVDVVPARNLDRVETEVASETVAGAADLSAGY